MKIDPEVADPFRPPKIFETIEACAGAKYAVELANEGNPDFYQSDGPLPGTLTGFAPVETLQQASEVCRSYIAFCRLGGGNWTGGKVYNRNIELVALVSYNGRVWTPEPDWNDRTVLVETKNKRESVQK